MIKVDEKNTEKLAEIFGVLSDPNRLRMLKILYQAKREMTCGEVGKKLNISKSTVSYHFKMMREVGLTNTRREAQSKYLSVRKETFNRYVPGLLDFL